MSGTTPRAARWLALSIVGFAGVTGGLATEAEAAPTPTATEITWLHDDYPGAIAAAKAADKPLVIDFWAPWCHTCLSMKHVVLTNPALAPWVDRFVWLAVDTDRPQNAGVVGKYPPRAWPTFLVVGHDETVQAQLVGSASVDEFARFLKRGRLGFDKAKTLSSRADLLRQADRASLQKDWDTALRVYTNLLNQGQLGSLQADVLVKRIAVFYAQKAWDACVQDGLTHLSDMTHVRSVKLADFVAYAHYCGNQANPALAKRFRQIASAPDGALLSLLSDAAAPLTADDRSDGLRIVRDMLDKLGRREQGAAIAQRQLALLTEAIKGAPSAEEAMTYNWPLVEVAHRLKQHEAVKPLVQASMTQLPKAYDPPYRMAWLLHKAGQHDAALAPATKARALVYGPRKARVETLIADIHQARGDVQAQREALQAVVATYRALPEGQKRPDALKATVEALSKLK